MVFCAFSWLTTILDAESAHSAVQVTAVDAHHFSGA
jgi:hypothetical protein